MGFGQRASDTQDRTATKSRCGVLIVVAIVGVEQIGESINVPRQLVGQITDQFEPARRIVDFVGLKIPTQMPSLVL